VNNTKSKLFSAQVIKWWNSLEK